MTRSCGHRIQRHAIVLLVALTAAASCGGGHARRGAIAQESFEWRGRQREYTVQTPATAQPSNPLILLLHLFQDDAPRSGAATHGYETFADQAAARGAVVVQPMGVHFSWNAVTCCGDARDLKVDDVGFLEETIKRVRQRVGHGPVFAVGFSNGGFMALRLACEGMPLAGVAIVEATMTVDHCAPRPTNLLQIHQTEDKVVPLLGTRSAATIATSPLLPVSESFARWRVADGCNAPSRRTSAAGVDTTTSHCASDTRARLVVIPGGGHSWPATPTAPVDASRVILDFFRL